MVAAAAESTWTGYSLAERDRRWNAVRQEATAAGLDCLFVPQTVDPLQLSLSSDSKRGVRSDARYLTQLDNVAVILPVDGRLPVVVSDRARGNDWVPEVRPAAGGMRGSLAPALAEALRELGMERAQIGVVGLSRGAYTHARADDGVINYASYAEVMRRLPEASFVNATNVVGKVRFVKSAEELTCFRHAVAIAEAGIEEMAAVARPGVDAGHLYARVTIRLLELGSERHDWALNLPQRHTNPPHGQALQVEQLLTNEVSAVWGHQLAQEDQPILLGPVPEDWKPLIDLQRELWTESLAQLRPGTTFGEVLDFVNGWGPARGMKSGVTAHGRGLGNEGPIITPRTAGAGIRSVRLESGNCFVWKPTIATADGTLSYTWAGDIAIGPHGGEKLGQRPVDIIAIT
jgi:Xaa-Pro dipeptidase